MVALRKWPGWWYRYYYSDVFYKCTYASIYLSSSLISTRISKLGLPSNHHLHPMLFALYVLISPGIPHHFRTTHPFTTFDCPISDKPRTFGVKWWRTKRYSDEDTDSQLSSCLSDSIRSLAARSWIALLKCTRYALRNGDQFCTSLWHHL